MGDGRIQWWLSYSPWAPFRVLCQADRMVAEALSFWFDFESLDLSPYEN